MDDVDGDDRLDHHDDDDEEENEDEDDEDEFMAREYRDEVRRQIDDNDPSLSDIWIGEDKDFEVYPNDGDWEGFGASLGRNTNIKEVIVKLNTTQMERGVQTEHFFQGLAKNRSIKSLDIMNFDAERSDMIPLMAPFFMNNKSLETLEISSDGSLGDVCLSKIAFAIGQFNSLTSFSLMGYYSENIISEGQDASSEGQDASRELIEALAGHAGLVCLSLKNVPIGRDACTALADLLRNPQVSLESLNLFRTEIDDDGADILSTGLIRNHTLTDFGIDRNGFTEIGWLAIFAMLKSPQCRLSCLKLHSNINDAVARSLANALRCNSTLKMLSLRQIHGITDKGWRDLFMGLLHGPHCILEKLDLSDSRGDDPDSMMESLASALAGNVNLKELHLFTSGSATLIGLQAVATILRNPNSALKELVLTGNTINDDIISAFASALTNNTKLKKLMFNGYTSRVTSVGYAAISRLLCDTSSILNTYNSNHTLESIGFVLSEDIYPLLSINHNNSIRQAARIKILNSHFSGSGINTQVFTDMTSNVFPTAISWMGHDNGSNGGMNLMFEFLRREPLICDTKSKRKKRKAAD